MRWTDAIERTQHLARTCRIPGLLAHTWGTRKDAVEGVINTRYFSGLDAYAKAPEPDEYARGHLATLFDRSEPYFVDARLMELIEASAPSLPLATRLHPRLFKSAYGCLLFERPVRDMPPRHLYTDPNAPDLPEFEPAPLSGFAWQTDSAGVVLVFLYSWAVDHSTPTWRNGIYVGNVPLSVTPWNYQGSTLGTFVGWHNERLERNDWGDTQPHNAQRFAISARVAVATLLLMDQTLTVVNTEAVDRATRKRAERGGWTHTPTVQVVKLRKVDRVNLYEHSRDVEWRCRWVVREHWRTLARGTPDERTVLVHEHLKGPEGLPIKPVNERVWAVVR